MSSASEPVLSSSEESVEEFETSDDSSSEEEDRKGVSKPTSHRAPPKHDDDSDAEKKFKLSTHTDAFDYEATLKQLKQLTSMSGTVWSSRLQVTLAMESGSDAIHSFRSGGA